MLILLKLLIANIFTLFLIIFVLLFFIKRYEKIQIILLLLIIIISISPLPNLLVYSIEKKNKPGNIDNVKLDFDNIVILSGNEDVKKTKKFNHLYLGGTNNRIIEGVRLHKKYNKQIIFSGSSLVKLHHREVYVAKKFFKAFGIDNDKIIIDDKASNTEDTFLFLKENFNSEKHLIVTSAMHMQRCKLLAKKNNIDHILYPVDFKANHENIFKFNLNFASNVDLFNYGLREISALIFYKISGKI